MSEHYLNETFRKPIQQEEDVSQVTEVIPKAKENNH
tara:strand:- start:861 stop:968 length:108 start_codon:yes stop_codon:yes gene_type:complete